MASFDLLAHTHLLTVAGSRAYGMHTPASDVDLKGMAVPPASWVYSSLRSFQQADKPADMEVYRTLLTDDERAAAATTKLEGSVYAMRKLVRLAIDSNPHVLDLLFCRDQEVRIASPIGEELRHHRGLFLSKRLRYSYGGYAASQLKRIETHRRWLLDPPREAPKRQDFGLAPMPSIPKAQLEAAQAAVKKTLDRWHPDFSSVAPDVAIGLQQTWGSTLKEIALHTDEAFRAAARTNGLSEGLIEHMARERRYGTAVQQYRQYATWKRRRNPERAALEAQHGYDTKHGAHLVRLLTMAVEVLETGRLHVWRGDRDAEELLAIRAGTWPYDELMAWVQDMEARLDQAVRTTSLPAKPDREAIDALVVGWMDRALHPSHAEMK